MYRRVLEGVYMKLVQCSSEILVVETLLEPGAQVPEHSHESSQASIVLKGSLVFGVEGQGEKVLRAGDYTIVPSGVKHWARALEYSVVLDVNWPLTRDRMLLVERLGGCRGISG
ncbi:MAG: cupin domain-containing protein [Desulfurococcales archaeon]|nr:cupin domain-containing protein [Desulfurococcales archaeon]